VATLFQLIKKYLQFFLRNYFKRTAVCEKNEKNETYTIVPVKKKGSRQWKNRKKEMKKEMKKKNLLRRTCKK